MLHAAVDLAAAATAMTDALLPCVGLLGAAFDQAEALDHEAAVLQAVAAAACVGLAVVGLALLLATVTHTELARVDLVGAVLDAALAAVLVEGALGRAVDRQVVAVIEAALLGLAGLVDRVARGRGRRRGRGGRGGRRRGRRGGGVGPHGGQ